jgi:hypothetical protein
MLYLTASHDNEDTLNIDSRHKYFITPLLKYSSILYIWTLR